MPAGKVNITLCNSSVFAYILASKNKAFNGIIHITLIIIINVSLTKVRAVLGTPDVRPFEY